MFLATPNLVPDTNHVSPIATEASPPCPGAQGRRSESDILWSCLATIFACTWIALHPNIPTSPRRTNFLQSMVSRAKLMAVALIAPELIILWASRQWFASHELAKMYQSHKWTQTHGFFAIMGGFRCMSQDADQNGKTLSSYHLHEYLRDGSIRIAAEDIMDRSKADTLSKALAVLQTTWFMLQFLARVAYRLPVTELELATLAFAVLNLPTYFFWWNKPLNVTSTVEVCVDVFPSSRGRRDVGVQASPLLDSDPHHREVGDSLNGFVSGELLVDPTMLATSSAKNEHTHFVEPTTSCLKTVLGSPTQASKPQHSPPIHLRKDEERRKDDSAQHRGITLLASAIGTIAIWFKALQVAFMREFILLVAVSGEETLLHSSSRLSPYYYGRLSLYKKLMVYAIASSIAAVFGGIHCIAWRFSFPSDAEQALWRVSATVVTCIPVYGFLTAYVLLWVVQGPVGQERSWVSRLAEVGWFWIFLTRHVPLLFSVLYVLARVVLLVQMFVLLLSPSEGVLHTIPWTDYIPHL